MFSRLVTGLVSVFIILVTGLVPVFIILVTGLVPGLRLVTGHGYRTTLKQIGLRRIRPYKPQLLLCVAGHHGSHKGCQFRLVV